MTLVKILLPLAASLLLFAPLIKAAELTPRYYVQDSLLMMLDA
jgi:hypothetical protein